MTAATKPKAKSTDHRDLPAQHTTLVLQFEDRVLTSQEVTALTRAERFTTQVKRLQSIGISPILSSDGAPAVTSLAVAIAMTKAALEPAAPKQIDFNPWVSTITARIAPQTAPLVPSP